MIKTLTHGDLQRIDNQAHNLKVVGSNPTPATKILQRFVRLLASLATFRIAQNPQCIFKQVRICGTLAVTLLIMGCSNHTAISPELYATSWHSRNKASGESYNQRNPGFGFHATQQLDNHWRYGVRTASYLNSIDKQSVYAAGTIDYCQGDTWHVCGGAMLGAVTGYEKPIKPLLAPVLGVGYERMTLNLTTFPIQNAHGVGVSGWVSIRIFEF